MLPSMLRISCAHWAGGQRGMAARNNARLVMHPSDRSMGRFISAPSMTRLEHVNRHCSMPINVGLNRRLL